MIDISSVVPAEYLSLEKALHLIPIDNELENKKTQMCQILFFFFCRIYVFYEIIAILRSFPRVYLLYSYSGEKFR